ncbi:hypothetical protein V5049_05415 [Moellerella wisconsensis]|uniref:Uncharacterized protein n=1 Tax=Moellerella wisconsensis ATCC 35017 TaxID=1354267 RepID=A0A0N0Z788_9GAMM|nr:hypothetical protein [Moellerella wisconsensis]KPD01997.1 hypothetical protein M992_2540 [Moellerella wisconsensis ATCC 35017]VFS54202.1 Uncharacterised protein [Moellerella wisconsensis]
MSEISHLATDKDIVTMGTAIISVVCLVIGGAIGFFTKYFYENKKINESKKALRQQMITNNIAPMRQAWINDLRKTSSEIIGHLQFIIQIKSLIKSRDTNAKLFYIEHRSKYYELLCQINYLELLLPANKDGSQPIESSNVKTKLENILNHLNKKTTDNNLKKTRNEIEQLSIEIKVILKKEWEVTKSLNEMK